MSQRSDEAYARIQPLITNRLSPQDFECDSFAAIIGERPSLTARSPRLWNAAFRALNRNSRFLALDVTPDRLADVVAALRASDGFIGGSVAVPYKIDIIPALDTITSDTAIIGAVNAIVRRDGQLVGMNTDGLGALRTLSTHAPGSDPFVTSFEGLQVLLLGAGGAARSVAVHLASRLGSGRLYISNRAPDRAASLAESVNRAYGNSVSGPLERVEDALSRVDLLINCTSVGQSGARRDGDGITTLEPYSPLAAASPRPAPAGDDPTAAVRGSLVASIDDVGANNLASLKALARMAPRGVFDVVYSPAETVLLRQARLLGHAGLNGLGMNLYQAVEAFAECVFGAGHRDDPASRPLLDEVFAAMAGA